MYCGFFVGLHGFSRKRCVTRCPKITLPVDTIDHAIASVVHSAPLRRSMKLMERNAQRTAMPNLCSANLGPCMHAPEFAYRSIINH